jgi:hypothetical protein
VQPASRHKTALAAGRVCHPASLPVVSFSTFPLPTSTFVFDPFPSALSPQPLGWYRPFTLLYPARTLSAPRRSLLPVGQKAGLALLACARRLKEQLCAQILHIAALCVPVPRTPLLHPLPSPHVHASVPAAPTCCLATNPRWGFVSRLQGALRRCFHDPLGSGGVQCTTASARLVLAHLGLPLDRRRSPSFLSQQRLAQSSSDFRFPLLLLLLLLVRPLSTGRNADSSLSEQASPSLAVSARHQVLPAPACNTPASPCGIGPRQPRLPVARSLTRPHRPSIRLPTTTDALNRFPTSWP